MSLAHLPGLIGQMANKPHGTRHRYIGGCRCLPCRAANSRYSCERAAAQAAGEWDGWVDADPVRAHLNKLSLNGIGYKAAAAAANVGKTSVLKIVTGKTRRIRATRAKALLAVDASCAADHSYVPAAPTWKLLDELIERGYSKAQLARWLGCKTPAIQIKRQGMVLAITASKVERMYNLVNEGRLRRDR